MDIDIDTKTSFIPEDLFPEIIRASMFQDNEIKKHLAGVYFQNIPTDPITKLSAIPFKEAEDYGFYKIDFLHLGLLDDFGSKQEIRTLLKLEPDWSLLENKNNYPQLFQISRHYSIVSRIKPTSIPELADCIALIRPGQRQLLEPYINAKKEERKKIRKLLYIKPEGGAYYFKKSHAHAYALTIMLQLHYLSE